MRKEEEGRSHDAGTGEANGHDGGRRRKERNVLRWLRTHRGTASSGVARRQVLRRRLSTTSEWMKGPVRGPFSYSEAGPWNSGARFSRRAATPSRTSGPPNPRNSIASDASKM